jgi:MFS family permease
MVLFTPLRQEMADDFGLSLKEFGAYASISTTLFGLGAIPSGWLGDRFGEKRLLLAFYWLTAAGGVMIGLARGTAMLAAGMALLGIGASIFHPVGNSLIAKGIPMPGRAMGTNGLWGSFGQALGPMLAVVIAAMLSWRAAYIALAPIMALFAMRLQSATLDVPRSEARIVPPRVGLLLSLLLLAMTLAGFNYWMVTTALPEHIEANTPAGFLPDAVRGGSLTSLIYLIGGLGQYLAGRAVHHREGRALYIAVFVLQAPLVYMVGRLGGLPLVVIASAMSVFLFAAQPIENVLLARFSSARGRGTLFGLKFTLAFGIAGVGPWLSSWVEESHGGPAVFTAAALFIAGALACGAAAFLCRPAAPESGGPAP